MTKTKPRKKLQTIQVRVRPETYQDIEQVSANTGIKTPTILGEAMRLFVEKYGRNPAAFGER